MVRVLVSDTSILIELAQWSLLESLFKLPLEFAIPDALYEDELLELGEINREQLKELGLRVESLDAEGMARATVYQTAQPKLTFHDCLALTLAVTNGWPLLTGDKHMQTLAKKAHLETHGVLWVIDQFAEHRAVSKRALSEALECMRASPRTWLPHNEIDRRLEALSGKTGG